MVLQCIFDSFHPLNFKEGNTPPEELFVGIFVKSTMQEKYVELLDLNVMRSNVKYWTYNWPYCCMFADWSMREECKGLVMALTWRAIFGLFHFWLHWCFLKFCYSQIWYWWSRPLLAREELNLTWNNKLFVAQVFWDLLVDFQGIFKVKSGSVNLPALWT